MFIFESDSIYPNGKSVNDVIQILQDRFHFLDKFDSYVSSRINEFDFISKGLPPNRKFNAFLQRLFQDFIIFRVHGIKTKEIGLSFVDSGLMLSSTFISYKVG